MTFDIYID